MISCIVSILPTLPASDPPFSRGSRPDEEKHTHTPTHKLRKTPKTLFSQHQYIFTKQQTSILCALYLTLSLLVIVHDLSLSDPLHVALQVLV